MSDVSSSRTQSVMRDAQLSALGKYRSLVVGNSGAGEFVRYELLTSLFGAWPGGLGLGLRRLFYPSLFKQCGRNAVFGMNLALRHPGRISLGCNVVIANGCTLDAKGTDGEGILIHDGVFIGEGVIVSMSDGTILIDDGANIGSYCRIGTLGRTRIGRKALLAAYCYVVGGGHSTDRTDIPILDQPYCTKGGVEIGDGCWLGARVTVMDGVRIGRDTIVGAHSLVTADLPEFIVAVGTPAKVTRSRKQSDRA